MKQKHKNNPRCTYVIFEEANLFWIIFLFEWKMKKKLFALTGDGKKEVNKETHFTQFKANLLTYAMKQNFLNVIMHFKWSKSIRKIRGAHMWYLKKLIFSEPFSYLNGKWKRSFLLWQGMGKRSKQRDTFHPI